MQTKVEQETTADYKPHNRFIPVRTRRDDKDPAHKSSVLFDSSVVPPSLEKGVLVEALANALGHIPGHRPVARHGTPSNSPLGRPLYVFTPGGTTLYREKDYALMVVYSNTGLAEKPRIHQAEYNDIDTLKPWAGPGSKQVKEIVVTQELLSAVRKGPKRKDPGIPDQNTVMAGKGVPRTEAGATISAQRMGIAHEGVVYNWCHWLAVSIVGPLIGQDPNNLSGATEDTNTDMCFAEDAVFKLMAAYDEVRVRVEAIEKCTHFAESIRFTIMTKDFTLKFVFNADTTVRPSLRNGYYVDALMYTLVNCAKDLIKKVSNPNPVKKIKKELPPMRLMFLNGFDESDDQDSSDAVENDVRQRHQTKLTK